MMDQVRELLAIAGTAARVNVHNHKSLRRPDLFDRIEAVAIIREWPAMDLQDQRIFPGRIEIRRLHDPTFHLALVDR